MTGPRICRQCGTRPQAYHGRGLCYDCKPGAKGRPLPCKRCGSSGDYWSAGLCRRCHQYAPQLPDSCRDCLAWPVLRIRGWTCEACTGWRAWYPVTGMCISCDRELHINPHQSCRLCWTQAKRTRPDDGPPDVIAGNRHGQQLMLAGMSSSKNGYRPHPRRPWRKPSPRPNLPRMLPMPGQLDLLAPDPLGEAARRYGVGEPPNILLAERLDHLTLDHAQRRSWGQEQIRRTRIAVRVLLAVADVTEPPIRASDVASLSALGLSPSPVRAVLTEADLFTEDRIPTLETWFGQRISGLPDPMAGELRLWFEVLYRGSTTPPRSRPRAPVTIKTRLLWTLPTLNTWAQAGHHSLREISRDQIIAVLPASGTPRVKLARGLRSIFTTLKARRIIFTDPTARLRIGNFERRTPLPADTSRLGAALNSPDPATAALAALLIFHGLRPLELRDLRLTDVRDGRCHFPDRTVLLANPVKTRLAAYLDDRHRRWPNSLNPHFFVHRQTTAATGPVSRYWVNGRLGMPARAVRQDRIVDEALATGGDLRRICDLFGVTIATAQHYTTVLGHPRLATPDSDPERTQDGGSAQ